MNELSVQIYPRFGTTPIVDIGNDLRWAEKIKFATYFPGGLFGPASFQIARDVDAAWLFAVGNRVVMRNGLAAVYEGYIVPIAYSALAAWEGRTVQCAGAWGDVLNNWGLNKPWCDMRLDEATWPYQIDTTTYKGAEKCTFDRNNRLRLTPKAVQFNNGEFAAYRLTVPTGQTAKRIVCNYELQEVALAQPNKVWHYDSAGPTYTDLTNAYDGSASTSVTVTITTGDYIYVGVNEAQFPYFNFVRVDMGGTVNANASTLTAEYWTGTAWAALAISDGTASAGKTLAVDGDITFTRPGDWDMNSVNGSRMYWVRFLVSANLTASTIINELTAGQTQAWELAIRNVGTSTDVVSVTTSGTGSSDHTLATPSQSLEVRLYARAQQLGIANGTVFAQLTNLKVYTETGSINAQEIAIDLVSHVTDLNSDTTKIGALTLTLEPFVTKGRESVAAILNRVVSFGDASFNAWFAQLLESEQATVPNGEPVLQVAQWPSIASSSAYDYTVNSDEVELEVAESAEVFNWIAVKRSDENGREAWVTPDDDSTLRDDISISLYGRREVPGGLDAGQVSATMALNLGKRYLAAKKNRQWYVTKPIKVVDTIRARDKSLTSACQVRAGELVRIENFLVDEIGSTIGLIQIVMQTQYDHDSQSNTLSLGVPDQLATFMARLAR